jgi:ATP-binding cassette subfamily B protein
VVGDNDPGVERAALAGRLRSSVAGWLRQLKPSAIASSPRVLLLRQLPGVSPWLTGATVLNVVMSALLPVGSVVASGVLVGRIPAAVQHGLDSPQGRSMIAALAALAVLYIVQFTVLPLLNQGMQALTRRVDRSLSSRVMAAVLAPTGIRHLEDPAVLDDVNKSEGLATGYTPGGALRGMTMMWTARLGGVGGFFLLLRFKWWLAIVLAIVAIAEQKFWRRRYDEVTAAIFDRGEMHRRSSYLRDASLTPIAAKEVRIFALQPWFARRFHDSWAGVMAPVWKDMRGKPIPNILATVLPLAATTGALALVANAALDHRISLASTVIFTQAIFTIGQIGSVGDMDEMVSRGVAALPVALDLEKRLRSPEFVAQGTRDPSDMPASTIRFEGVHFCYPGRNHDVYAGLDLEIPAGHSLAVVGANGAGKTTLVKLLARMYEPTTGRITVDGIDIGDLDPGRWQTRIAAIFQDFRKYHLPARDNVEFGAPSLAGDGAALERSARRAGVLELIEGLESGWDTPLERQLKGGTDLSGGQWQRVALARALYAVEGGAGVLVLDEPTAALDVRTEAELYERFLDLTEGLTTIVISHRFSTVRRADCIVVLDGGRVVERGTHDELIALGGQYATMFALQASRYKDDPLGDKLDDPVDEGEVTVGG